jgi:outer membrane protein
MLLRTLITGLLITAGAFAQLTNFPKPNYFRETFNKTQTKVELKDPVRLKDFVHDGKLELSLKDYLNLVMSNNTNIQIQMLTLETPKNAIQRAFGQWDPNLTASFNSQRARQNSTQNVDGSIVLSQLSQPFQARYQQTIDTGTQYNVQFNAQKSASNSPNNRFNPNLSSGLQMGFTQPLLRDRGRYVNRLSLMVARSNLRISEYTLRNNLITSITNAENAYWQVVLQRENLKVAQGARATAQEQADFVQRQLDLGALSPLDIFQTQQLVAQQDLNLANAQFSLTRAEEALRLQIAVDLDPQMRSLPIVLTEQAEVPNADSINFDPEPTVEKALRTRPDLQAANQRLDVDDLQIYQSKNGLLPRLNLTGNYQSSGLNVVKVEQTPGHFVNIPGGFSDTLGQMFGFGFPTYSFGLTLNLPIRSHAASADLADALLRKKTDAFTLRNQQQNTRLQVLQAITDLNGAKEQLKLALKLREISQSNSDAMKKKYELGTELLPNVVRAAQDLNNAEYNVVSQQISLRRNVLNLLTATGELLEERGIVIQ